MSVSLVAILETVVSAAIGSALLALFRKLNKFMAEQREANRLNSESIRSMQRDAILRMYQSVVEEGKPITVEELDHLKKCYNSYHNNGGNGTGTYMYGKIIERAVMVTKAEGGDSHGN